MKKIIKAMLLFVMAASIVVSAVSCGNNNGDKDKNTTNQTVTTDYTSAEGLLSLIWDSYDEEKKFPAAGGDESNMNMEGPGKYSTADAEVLDNVLGFPASSAEKIDDAASLMHAMNQNTFTCAAYHFKNANDLDATVSTVKNNILARQWMCGFPDSLLIITVPGNYLITVWGIDEGTGNITTFKTAVQNAISGAKIVADEPII